MRDIRNDLQDRASLLDEQINAAEAQFEKLVEQLRTEHEGRLEDLKAEFEAVSRLLEVEQRRLANIPVTAPAPKAQPQPRVLSHPQPHAQVHSQMHPQSQMPTQSHAQPHQQQAQPQQPLTDFVVRQLNEAGAMSREDLRLLTVQEGYFIDADSAERGVHAALVSINKAGLIRQLPNGNFAPATVMDTIRLRRAI